MKIAIPTAEGRLCQHFGHCQQFAIIDVDTDKKEILKTEMMTPPPHEPGVLPGWLKQQGCTFIIAGGMGGRAIGMFGQYGIGVITGAPPQNPEDVVTAYLDGQLIAGGNPCTDDNPGFHQGGQGKCQSHERE